jgi:hypothetical protein
VTAFMEAKALRPRRSFTQSLQEPLPRCRSTKLSALRAKRLARCRTSLRWAAQAAEHVRLFAMRARKGWLHSEHVRVTPGSI